MELKDYQRKTLRILTKFFQEATLNGVKLAFENNQDAEGYEYSYKALPNFENVPYICLRIPTGGGKTLIGTQAIQIAAENFLKQEFPFVLWIMPTTSIRQQTLKVLSGTNYFYNQFLYNAFNGSLSIFDVTQFRELRPQDLRRRLNICVATFQSLRVRDKEGRKIYQADEELSACFEKIPFQNYFITDDNNRYESFANLLAYLRPLMIIDEAHNYKTNLSLDVMKNLRPSAVIELTATPADCSNVLVKITADELFKESMIKMPVTVGTVNSSPEKTLELAIQKRNFLEEIAAAEDEYIRPITLYQAENVNGEYNVDYVKNYLIETAKIPAEQVAIATGEKKEIAGKDLFARNCPIRHIITVQALKEGWDCSFASVFCSLANTHSSKDAEQLLGRVLRMPYAKKRKSPPLNKAYAFLLGESWNYVVGQIKDNLTHLGFERREVNRFIDKQTNLPLTRTVEFETETSPDTSKLSDLTFLMKFYVEQVDNGFKVKLQDVTSDDIEEIEALKDKIFKTSNDRANFVKAIKITQKDLVDNSPSARGVKFEIPQLCFNFNGKVTSRFDAEDFLPDDWNLVDVKDYDVDYIAGDNDVVFTEFTSKNDKLTPRTFIENDNGLFDGITNWTQEELVTYLSDKLNDDRIEDDDLREFTQRVICRLINEQEILLEELVRRRFYLKSVIERKINRLIEKAQEKYFKANLNAAQDFTVDKNIAVVFTQSRYPAKDCYTGNKFNKHFYPNVGALNDEEVICATLIDINDNVETWIRNVEREPEYSFYLPLHKNNFYPDFVVKLKDGTYAAIEYKGKHLESSDDTAEKRSVGELWASKSGGQCKFLMALKEYNGKELATQLKEFFAGKNSLWQNQSKK